MVNREHVLFFYPNNKKLKSTAVLLYLLMLLYSSKEKLPEGLMHRCCSRIAGTKEGFNSLLSRSKSSELTAQNAKV